MSACPVCGGPLAPLHFPSFAERNRAIVEAVRPGDRTLDDIGREFGITRERVRQIAKAAGITARGRGRRRNPSPTK